MHLSLLSGRVVLLEVPFCDNANLSCMILPIIGSTQQESCGVEITFSVDFSTRCPAVAIPKLCE